MFYDVDLGVGGEQARREPGASLSLVGNKTRENSSLSEAKSLLKSVGERSRVTNNVCVVRQLVMLAVSPQSRW